VFAVIDELNKSWKNLKYRASLECLSWEESVHAAAGKPEEVIKKQLPFEKSDILIAILWKRFGTPTLTNNLDDGHPYLSGTQQEIEESYACFGRTGRPIIMVYRKDHDIPPNMSAEELNQLRLVNEFLDEFKPGGKYPALIKTFKENEFRDFIKRELEQAVERLVASRRNPNRKKAQISQSPGPGKKKAPGPTNPIDPAAKDATETWLKKVQLKDNPFRHQYAEHDEKLPEYFTRFPDLHAVTSTDLTLERKSWFFFGNDGMGKTALRKFIAARGRSLQRPEADMVCVEYDDLRFQHLLNNTGHITEFQVSFVQSIFDAVLPYTGNAIQSSRPPDSLREALTNLSVELRKLGINWVLCLLDPGRPSFEWKGSKVSTSTLITSIFSLAEVGGYGFRYFLPASIKGELKPTFVQLPFNYIRILDIRWDERALREMLSKRMTQLSVDQLAPYRSLGELCEDKNNLSTLIDPEIASFAQGNPRAAMWLANRLIEQHCDNYPVLPRIANDTWEMVKLAWREQGESRILGVSETSEFRVLSGRSYYHNNEIILPERSDRLLKALILAHDGFCSKQELIKAGWVNEKNLEGISEKALSEAIRRMKEELKKELKARGFEPFDYIKSVRGRGYRLLQPGRGKNEQESRND
jgi:DNA-binding winged helix-turn-helix (wHTH) protein